MCNANKISLNFSEIKMFLFRPWKEKYGIQSENDIGY